MGCGGSKSSFRSIGNHHKTLEEVQNALREAGLESSNCTSFYINPNEGPSQYLNCLPIEIDRLLL